MKDRYLLVFGSLRKNSKRGYNFNRFGGQTFLKEVDLDGFKMVSLGPYPAIYKGEGKIKCELHKVAAQAYKNIYRMELGAGYEELTLDLDNIKASIFVMDKNRLENYPVVKNGDWN